MVAGLRAAERDFGVGFGIIPAIARFQRPEDAVALVRQVLDDGRPEVLGIGQDDLTSQNSEAPERWAAAYALAARHGLRRTAHVAEIPGSTADAVTVAIRDLDCSGSITATTVGRPGGRCDGPGAADPVHLHALLHAGALRLGHDPGHPVAR